MAVLAWRLSAARVASLTLALDAIAGALVVLTLVQVVPITLDRTAEASAPLPDRPAANPDDPDIYFLIFDRYGSEESIKHLTGVDNDLPAFLESRGFTVAHDAHSNYGRTAMSIASTFDLDYLDDLIARVGTRSTDFAPLNEMLQDHRWAGRSGSTATSSTSWARGSRPPRPAGWRTRSSSPAARPTSRCCCARPRCCRWPTS